ncbi:DUF3891 family protein [Frankia sp. AgB1.8]|uniref:DUF3891 family protein n=3 Tax=Frankia TaxID=1854 RepID=UPI0019321802|nr:DUF3891 family protein [Frankia sp. AgB1.8]MBL7623605.1 DUF3891 family protein [Frankia sp. AgB1.8]
MIITRYEGRLLVVRQPDHGDQTGLFATAWGNEDVPALAEHQRAATLAARHHDDGWAVWERRPSLDPATRQPTQFHKVGPVEHIPAYRAGVDRAAHGDPWAGLLVSLHAAGLYNGRYGTFRLPELADQSLTAHEQALVTEFLAEMDRLQRDLLGAVRGHPTPAPAFDDPVVRQHYLLLQVWDRLSLQFAFRHGADGTIAPLPALGGGQGVLTCRSVGAFALALDPYPFATEGAVFPVAGQLVPDRPYRDPEDFLATLASAPALQLDCRVQRAGTAG